MNNMLADIKHRLYKDAEWYWQVSIMLAAIVVPMTIAALWSKSPLFLAIIGVTTLAAPIVVAWMREHASVATARADKCRRMILYADGLGLELEPAEVAQVRSWSIGSRLAPAPFIPPYYHSLLPPGAQRLADILAESSFFTETLARKVQITLWALFGVLILGSMSALSIADQIESLEGGLLVVAVKSIAVFVAFLISGDFALLAKKFGDLRIEAATAFQRAALLRRTAGASILEVVSLAEDYGLALVRCPPIPSWVYGRYRDRINDAYRNSHSEL